MEAKPIVVAKNIVPDLKGMGAKDAMFLLGQLGLQVQFSGRGKVIHQNIAAGTRTKKGQLINIKLE
jgi:cell division protein FtsI (penicillin-binding protein 3)